MVGQHAPESTLVIYQDGAPMFSTGGILKRRKDVKKFVRSPFLHFPYIRTGNEILDIETPILTNSEIDLLNSHLPNKKKMFLNSEQLRFIPNEEKKKYFDLYRYYPSYVEIRDF